MWRRQGERRMNLDFTKLDGLIPAVIQDDKSGRVPETSSG
jgi:hypothetical protein